MVVSPWLGWVYARTGRLIPLSDVGPASLIDGLTFAVGKDYRQGMGVPQDVFALMQSVHEQHENLRSYGDIATVLADQLRIRPLAVAKLFVFKAMRSWYATDSGRLETLIMVLQGFYLTLVSWGTIVAWRSGGLARQFAAGLWIMALYFWGMNILSATLVRYSVPTMAFLFAVVPALSVSARGRLEKERGDGDAWHQSTTWLSAGGCP